MSEVEHSPGDWMARNARPVPGNAGRPIATDYARAVSALEAIPGNDPDWRLILASWALEFDRAGEPAARTWFARCTASSGVAFDDAYRATPEARITFVLVRAAHYGWLDPLPAAVKSREANAKQRAAYEEKARKARERVEAKAAREAARAAKFSTTRRKAA
ncbi:hypothetical protein PPMP20_37975 [Paraburkholderia phymatum]|uniref:Uncharacterized protein n=1 Tax=Paraburkholderia phymatum (strain DSM 17167 / CIP 108236 / LMG 21445 / STM815) TaxID=391038 RepID=B2JV39_PARP8|nr:hypothetical protein [Paraburkholderia phymatum]ACC74816.1 hypothetical protein Bphy_5750 [Paraburkholderia phymatum STM815]